MTQQLTPQAVTVMIVGLILFWVSIATLVRLHGRQRAASTSTHSSREPGG